MSRILSFQTRLNAAAQTAAQTAAAAALLALTGLLLVDVIARGAGRPLFGAQELAEAAMILVVFGALARIEAGRGQIKVDLLAPILRGWPARILDKAAALLGLLLWAALAAALWQAAELSALLGLASNLLALPRAPIQLGLAALAGLAAMANLALLIAPADDRKGAEDE